MFLSCPLFHVMSHSPSRGGEVTSVPTCWTQWVVPNTVVPVRYGNLVADLLKVARKMGGAIQPLVENIHKKRSFQVEHTLRARLPCQQQNSYSTVQWICSTPRQNEATKLCNQAGRKRSPQLHQQSDSVESMVPVLQCILSKQPPHCSGGVVFKKTYKQPPVCVCACVHSLAVQRTRRNAIAHTAATVLSNSTHFHRFRVWDVQRCLGR